MDSDTSTIFLEILEGSWTHSMPFLRVSSPRSLVNDTELSSEQMLIRRYVPWYYGVVHSLKNEGKDI